MDNSDESSDDSASLVVMPPQKSLCLAALPAKQLTINSSVVRNQPTRQDPIMALDVESSCTETNKKSDELSLSSCSSEDEEEEEEELDKKIPAQKSKKRAAPLLSLRERLSQNLPDSDDDSDPFDLNSQIKPSLAAEKQQPNPPARQQKKKESTTIKNAAPKREEKERLKRQKEQEREAAKKRKAEESARAKQAKEDERQRARLAKQQADLVAKQVKASLREQARQHNGTFCKQEIAILMERKLHRNADLNLPGTLQQEGYRVEKYDSLLNCNAIQWIRQDHLKGGADGAVQNLREGQVNGYIHLPYLAIVFEDSTDFIRLMDREDREEDDDYPKLGTWLRSIEAGWTAAWKYAQGQRPTIFLFLLDVDRSLNKLWTQYNRKSRSERASVQAPPSDNEFHDAIAWMLIQFQVDCIKCSDANALANEICKMTRMLSEEPYQKVFTDLDCVPKFKRSRTESDPIFDQAKDIWHRQLQVIPQMSCVKARNLTKYYPTAHSLWQAYQNPNLNEAQKQVLIADLLSESRQVKLSSFIFQIMTSTDPNQMLR